MKIFSTVLQVIFNFDNFIFKKLKKNLGCGPIPSQLDNFGQTKGGEHYKFSLLSIVLVCLVSYKKHKSSQDNAVAVKLGMIT